MTCDRWTSEKIEDQGGKTVIVTGANSGIGYETARVLAGKGAEVILACRSAEKSGEALGRIKAEFPEARVETAPLDLASLESVRSFAAQFLDSGRPLHILVNNAGVMAPPFGKTAEGFEMQIGVNHLGHFALTGLLLGRLLETAGSRVVSVSSVAHRYGKIDLDDLCCEKKRYGKWKAYGQSKLANLLFTYELQRRLESAGARTLAAAAHPGWTATNLQRTAGLFRFMNPAFAQKPEQGAWPTLYAATEKGVRGGEYYGPDGFMEGRGHPKLVQSNAASRDPETAAGLWELSEKLVDVHYEALKAAK